MKNYDLIVFAPHPDDEALGCAGLIYKAVQEKKKIKVVIVTNGESSAEGTEWYYGHKPSTQDFIDIGYVRQKESMAAMKVLGLGADDVVFLGYPDNGLMVMMSSDKFTMESPYRSEFTFFDRVTHRNSYSMDAPFCRESLCCDIQNILLECKPVRIYVTHPLDSHSDHKVCGQMVHEISGGILDPGIVLGYKIARSGIPSSKRRSIYRSTGQLTEKYLDEATLQIKKRCINEYKSQSYLFNELCFHYEVERFWKLDEGMRAAIAKKIIPSLRD